MWTPADIEIRISDGETDDPVVTVEIVTPAGTPKMMAEFDIDGIVVEGEVRTTGAGPGHRPRPVRFTRKIPSPGR